MLLFRKDQAHAQCYQYETVETAEKTDSCDIGDGKESNERDDA